MVIKYIICTGSSNNIPGNPNLKHYSSATQMVFVDGKTTIILAVFLAIHVIFLIKTG